MVIQRNLSAMVALFAILGLAACGGDEPLQGRGYQPPSNVTSTWTIPLTVPPDYGVRPSGEEDIVVAGGTVIDQLGTIVEVTPFNVTLGEQILLTKAGVQNADPTVRALLNRENSLLVGQPLFVEELLFGSYPPGGTVDLSQGGDVEPNVVIEQPGDESNWFDDTWASLGQ